MHPPLGPQSQWLAQLGEGGEDVFVIPGHLDFLNLHIGHLAVLVDDDGGALTAVQRLEVQAVLLHNFAIEIGKQTMLQFQGVRPCLVRKNCRS